MLALIASAALIVADVPPASSDETQQAYQAAKASAGRTPDDQVRLAYWCEAHGLGAERMRHLAQAVLADPNHFAARGLLGLVSRQGRWMRPEAVVDQVKADPTLAEYDAKRSSTPYTADGQQSLARWAEERGLAAQAKAHYTAVVRLDPKREPIWKKLGYKKQNGKWTTDAELAASKADSDAQKAADQKWRTLLEKWRTQLAKPGERAEAEANLMTVTDPRAVRQVEAVFLSRSANYQAVALRTLAQIDSAAASRLITMLAILSPDPEVRRAAVETLRLRDPRDYADLLIRGLRERVEYEVQNVSGPGSMGRLLVKSSRQKVQRLYATPAVPNYLAWLTQVSDGSPTLSYHYQGAIHTESVASQGFTYNNLMQYRPATDTPYGAFVHQAQANAPAMTQDFINHHHKVHFLEELFHKQFYNQYFGFNINTIRDSTTPTTTETTIPLAAMVAEYQKTALVAQQQIARDAAIIDDYNRQVDETNDRLTQVLRTVSSEDYGADVSKWAAWMGNLSGYSLTDQSQPEVPTETINIPLAYQPQTVPIGQTTSLAGPTTTTTHFQVTPWVGGRGPDCFGAGTLVRTITGPRAIETLRIGDLVLTQSTATGALNYQPILLVHHNPPSPTFRVKLDGESIVTSPFHRFWKAGQGWVMARDVQAGDRLRILSGTAVVEESQTGNVERVYNLDIAEDADFFAGSSGVLVHDNTLLDPRLVPFDLAPVAASKAVTAR